MFRFFFYNAKLKHKDIGNTNSKIDVVAPMQVCFSQIFLKHLQNFIIFKVERTNSKRETISLTIFTGNNKYSKN